MKDSRSEHKQQSLNARLLRFRSQPDSEDAYALAEELIAAQRYADARSVATSAQPKDVEDGGLLLLEGRAHLLERDLVRAQAVLLRAVRVAPDLQPAYRYLGEVLLKRGDPERAARTLHRALSLDPEDADAAKLAARAEYLAEAANDGLEALPSQVDSAFDSEPAARRSAPPPAESAAGGGGAGARGGRASQPTAATPSRPAADKPGGARPPAPRLAPEQPERVFEPPTTEAPARSRGAELRGRAGEGAGGSLRTPGGGGSLRTPGAEGAGTSGSPSLRTPAAEAGPSLRARGAEADGGSPSLRSRGAASSTATPAAGRGLPPSAAGREAGVRRPPPEPSIARGSDPARQAGSPPPPAAPPRATVAQPQPPAARPLTSRGPTLHGAAAPPAPSPPPPRERLQSPASTSDEPGRGASARARPSMAGAPRSEPSAAQEPRARSAASSSLDPRARQHAEPVAQGSLDPHRSLGKRLSDFKGVRPERGDPSSTAIEVSASVATIESDPPPSAAAPNAPADAEQVLELVQQLGLFEAPSAAPATWAQRSEVAPSGQRLRNALIALWVVTLVLCGGGYYGWRVFVERRHAKAAALVADARALMLRGDHGAMVDAERMLRLAREQHPASEAIPSEALVLQAERVLEDGERDMAALQSAYARAHGAPEAPWSPVLTQALLAAASGDGVGRDRALADVLAKAPGDARALYLVGRAEQRAGLRDAPTHLQAAAQAEPKLTPARLALAELAYDRGEREAAKQQLAAAHEQDPEQLRVQLFSLFVDADDADTGAVSRTLAGLADSMKKAGNVDRALDALIRARLARREGKSDAAAKAVETAANSGTGDARVLAWVAREALAVGTLPLAQHTASQALSAAPDLPQNRRLLARILIERNDGEHAFTLLTKLLADDLEAQVMKAQAALLSSDPNALRSALSGLTEVAGAKSELATRIAALRLRIEAKLEPNKSVLDRARSLARSVPGDQDALLALAEAALAMHEPALAQNALKQRFAVAPDDPNAHTLLGRARRMAADAAGAEASFRRALALAPGHLEALTALAGLLLDTGNYADADAAYQELATHGGGALSGRLGRVEALIGLSRVSDAQVQLDAVPEAQHNLAAYRETAARLALVRGKPGDALTLLRPLVDEQAKSPTLLALYADALREAQQLEAAGSAYDSALALDPELPEALLGRAELQLSTAKPNDVLATLVKAQSALSGRIRPKALEARRLVLVGRAHALRNKRGDADAAREALRAAVQIPGAPADASYFLAEALGGRGNPEAVAAYRHYLELDPRGRYAERVRRLLGVR